MHTHLRAALMALAVGFLGIAPARSQDSIPPPLREWQGWVLKGEEFRRCPFLSNVTLTPGAPIDAAAYRCAWPERLNLAVDARGGAFTQRWQVYAAGWVQLPGDAEHWPRDVRLNGAPAAVVQMQGFPQVRVAAGSYALSGRFEWSARPEALPLPPMSALVDLTVDGQRVAQPERPDGAIWLGKRRSEEQRAAMEVQVYRLVQDDIPTYLVTRIRLNVAGDAREELLAPVLPDGFTPVSLAGDLPARIERDGRLRVQVRAGAHEVRITARAAQVVAELSRPDAGEGLWPREEVWSFAANDALRVAAAEGADGIDPAQANVPNEWRQLPAFRMPADGKLTLVERSRGLSNSDANRLSLARDLWLDFDHQGFTAVDRVVGSMRRDWRLDMQAPFALASAMLDGEQLLVTDGVDGRAGVELRQPRLDLATISRKVSCDGAMPATGWDARFERVAGALHLPPGHRLLAAIGADSAPQSWWESWGLWNVFGVLIVVVFVHWAAGRIPALLAAVALLLTYQEAPGYIWLWGNLLAALAIARAAPEGRFRSFANAYRTLSFGVLALALLPLLWTQVRYALYPQLEPATYVTPITVDGSNVVDLENPYGLEALWDEETGPLDRLVDALAPANRSFPDRGRGYANQAVVIPDGAVAEAAAPAAPPALMAPVEESLDMAPREISKLGSSSLGLNARNVVQRYAAGTVLQAGPGRPAWRYNSYNYYWSGPVEPSDTVRFIYIGPALMFIWRIAGVLALAALFAALAVLSYGGPGALGRLRLPGRPPGVAASWLTALMLPFALALVAAPVQAQVAPSPELLEELKTRLTAAPECAPACADVSHARVSVEGDRLEVVLQVSALAKLAVAMPHASDRWQLDEVSVDSRGALTMARQSDASLWVPLDQGAHTVRLAGRLASAESIQLVFPQRPRTIDVSARGWTANGVNEGRLVSGSLDLTRLRDARGGAPLAAGSEFPAFVRVDRTFILDLDWSIDTLVSRIAPQRAAISTEVPLVAGESVLTPGIEVRDGRALVGLGTAQAATSWHSGLVRSEALEISLPEDAARTESWNFIVNPQWNVSFAGFAAVLPENPDDGNWVFRFIPRPGEKLALTITRPTAVQGTTLAIDRAGYHTIVGQRAAHGSLQFEFRSTQGGRHIVRLPPDARVTEVRFDGQPQQVRPEKGELQLSLAPGSHRFDVEWEESRDVGLKTQPSKVDIGSPASNVRASVSLPDSRWVLFVSGPGVGPAVAYWGEIIVFAGMAWLLSLWPRSPLKLHEWLLLGLGLSTQSWFVFGLTAAWLAVMKWREGWQPAADSARWRFNLTQILLALFTVIVIATLVFSGIRNGLLARPDMSIYSAEGANRLVWFQDLVSGEIGTPTVWSVPMGVYRFLMLAWAGWMAFALVRWLRWAFNAWKAGGLWRAR